jgi:hypothetical protein
VVELAWRLQTAATVRGAVHGLSAGVQQAGNPLSITGKMPVFHARPGVHDK